MEDKKVNFPDRRPPSLGEEWDPKEGIAFAIGITLLIGLLYLIFKGGW